MADLCRPPQSIEYRVQEVLCPVRGVKANITAASWKMSWDRWTSWQVVDCSVMPAGSLTCDRSCVPQLGVPAAARTRR
jgi:hypothetical protein